MVIKRLTTINKLLIPYIIGIIIAFYYPKVISSLTKSIFIITILIVLAGLASLKYTKNNWFGYTFLLFYFFLGFFYTNSCNSSLDSNYFKSTNSTRFLVKISEPPGHKTKTIKVIGSVLQNANRTTSGNVLLYLEKDTYSKALKYNDKIIINTIFSPIKANGNPHEFNYERYLKIFDIHHQAYLKKHQWQHVESKINLMSYIYKLRSYFSDLIDESILKAENKKVAKALLLGQKEELDPTILKSFSSAGAMHVLAVSGLHVGIIMVLLQFIFKPLKRVYKGRIYTLLILFFVWCYALITGFSPSVVRAAIMFSFIIIGRSMERDTSIYQSIFVAAFITLLIDPLNLFKVGFQLSFLAVIGIVSLQPRLYHLFYFKGKPLDYAWKITSVSIAAQLATFPLGLYYFHQFPNLFFVSNLLVIPLAGCLLTFGFIYFLAHPFHYFKIPLEHLLDLLFSGLNQTVNFIEQIPYAISWGISISWIEALLMYLLIALCSVSLISKNARQFILAMTTAAVLLISLNLKRYHTLQTKELIVYNIKNDFALDIFNGRKNQFLASDELIKNEQKLLFHIKHNWYYKKHNDPPNQILNYSTKSNYIFNLNSKSFLILNNLDSSKIILTDYVILDRINFISEDLINDWNKTGAFIILHPNLKYGVKQFVKQKIPDQLLFDISKRGAFRFNF